MESAILFAAILLGLIHPKFIRNPKAFGISIILVIGIFIAEVAMICIPWIWSGGGRWFFGYGVNLDPQSLRIIVMALAPLLKVVACIEILRAYWPGGKLLNVASHQEKPPQV